VVTQRTLRARLGTVLIVGHIVAGCLAGVLMTVDRLTMDDLWMTLVLLGPLFLTYLPSVLHRFVGQPVAETSPEVSVEQYRVSMGFSIVVFVLALAIIGYKGFGSVTPTNYYLLLGALESFAGFGVGVATRAAFGES